MAAFKIEGDLKAQWIEACKDIPRIGSQSGYTLKKDTEVMLDLEAWLKSFDSKKSDENFATVCGIVGRNIETIQSVLQAIGFAVDMTAIAFPLISPATLVVNVFAWLFGSLAAVSERFDEIAGLFKRIGQKFDDLSIIKEHLKKDIRTDLQKRIVDLFISCLNIYRVASEELKKGSSKDGMKPAMLAFEDASEALKNFFPIATFGSVETLIRNHEELSLRANRDEILDWLSKLPYQELHDWNRKGIEETDDPSRFGKWLLNSHFFKDWEEGDVDKIWYTGNPGAGKSVLASIIINHLQTLKRSVAYLYLSYTSTPQVKDLLGSIVRQLQPEDGIHPDIVAEFERARKNGKFAGEIQSLTENGISRLLTAICQGKAIFIIVDALDEFDFDYRGKLLKHLTNLGPCVKILVTSRVLRHLEALQTGFSTAKIEANDLDMDEYIRCQLDSKVSESMFRDKCERIQDMIKQKSGRMFIIVRLHVKAVLSAGNPAELEDILTSLPADLNGNYKKAMERIRKQANDVKSRAESVLAWIAFAQRQLTEKELYDALAIREKNEAGSREPLKSYRRTDVISECQGLVIVDSEHLVRFVHRSAREYFDNHKKSELPDSDKQITIDCVKYLSVVATAPQKREASGVHVYAKECSVLDGIEKDYWLIKYAGAFLHKHHRKIRDGERDEKLLDAIEKFVTCKRTRALYGRLLCRYKGYDSKSIFTNRGKKLDSKYSDWGSFSPLQVAVYLGNVEIVQIMIGREAKIDVTDPYGRTPLEVAIDCGLDSVAGVLLQHGARVDLKTQKGHFILQHAMERSYWTVVRQIIGHSGPALPDGNFLQIIGLVIMVIFAQLQFLMSLFATGSFTTSHSTPKVHEGSHPEFDPLQKYRALLQHSYEGNADGLRHLLDRKAADPIAVELVSSSYDDSDSETGDSDDFDAGYFDDSETGDSETGDSETGDSETGDSETGDSEAGDSETDKGGSTKESDLRHANDSRELNELRRAFLKSACFLAVERDNCSAVSVFLNSGVSENLTNLSGQSLLHRATFRNNEELVKSLLQRDVIVDQRDENGRSALTAYADPKRRQVLELLLEKGADINLRQKSDIHELYEAAVFGAQAAVDFFLNQNVDPSIANYYGWTPLHGAAANGHYEIVKHLVQQGAEPSPLSDTFKTPLDFVTEGRKHYDRILTGWGQYAAQVIATKERSPAVEAENRDEIANYLRVHGARHAKDICDIDRDFEYKDDSVMDDWWDAKWRHWAKLRRSWETIEE
ncbi:Ankyrin repeat protein [Beauveria bassiana ARSEF 2860]|uniref:Ankyrin repeat protein n=1 Tax=Beauveria bassiana (strain ARSEF 2860) TaxID=655819 RepID=J4UQM8_BEAB2|nr:Ankyrin repeat protein [Beauveria bassiana ARSEF 2860]EJP67692.1 Ankyrin repeat protein [Beauveria bassiana ARSEF 2860]